MKLLGIHHITAIASDPQRNVDFYTQTLGLRLVKRTVNFDDPSSYHFYFGDGVGKPGTVITFFPWPGARRGTRGSSQVVATSFAIPQGSLNYWSDHLKERALAWRTFRGSTNKVCASPIRTDCCSNLIASPEDGDGAASEGEHAVRGFHAPTLQLQDSAPTQKLLTETLGFQQIAEEGPICLNGPHLNFPLREARPVGQDRQVHQLDLVERPDDPHGHIAAGHGASHRVSNAER